MFSSEDFQRWRGAFYDRLKQHVAAASKAIGELVAVDLVWVIERCLQSVQQSAVQYLAVSPASCRGRTLEVPALELTGRHSMQACQGKVSSH